MVFWVYHGKIHILINGLVNPKAILKSLLKWDIYHGKIHILMIRSLLKLGLYSPFHDSIKFYYHILSKYRWTYLNIQGT